MLSCDLCVDEQDCFHFIFINIMSYHLLTVVTLAKVNRLWLTHSHVEDNVNSIIKNVVDIIWCKSKQVKFATIFTQICGQKLSHSGGSSEHVME